MRWYKSAIFAKTPKLQEGKTLPNLRRGFCGLTQTLPPHEVDLCLSKQRIFGNTKIQSLSGATPETPRNARCVQSFHSKEVNKNMRIKPNRKRTIEFKVMLSPEEAELLKKKSEESGLSRSEVLRSLLTGRRIAKYREGSTTPSHFGKTIRKDGN